MIKFINVNEQIRKMKILALSPHPDDVELGAGGFVLQALNNQCEVDIIYCLKEKEQTVEKNAASYQYNYSWLSTKRPEFTSIFIKKIDKILYSKSYTHFLIPHLGDKHQDHKIVNSLGQASARKFKGVVLQYEVSGYANENHSFSPNIFVGIDDQVENKLAWAGTYEDVTDKLLETTRGLNRVRGYNTDNNYAEAFELLKWNM